MSPRPGGMKARARLTCATDSAKAVLKTAEMVHDTDFQDGKFQTTECVGIDRLLEGWAKTGLTDDELLLRGTERFEALFRSLRG